MKVYFAADHAGFELKNELINLVRGEMNLDVEDCGALSYDAADDYPAIIAAAARKLSTDVAAGKDSRAIVIGGSGTGEAIVANRFAHVRAAVYYGDSLDIVKLSRAHNDANALSLAARFVSKDEAKEAVRVWLSTAFSHDERHERRISQIDSLHE